MSCDGCRRQHSSRSATASAQLVGAVEVDGLSTPDDDDGDDDELGEFACAVAAASASSAASAMRQRANPLLALRRLLGAIAAVVTVSVAVGVQRVGGGNG
jgi:hypothetical protein